jgi:hypothetical protein
MTVVAPTGTAIARIFPKILSKHEQSLEITVNFGPLARPRNRSYTKQSNDTRSSDRVLT